MPTYLKSSDSTSIKSDSKSDSIELSNKETKKKVAKYAAIAAGAILLIIALIKRNKITKFLSRLFEKKPPEGPRPPEPPMGSGSRIKGPGGGGEPPAGGSGASHNHHGRHIPKPLSKSEEYIQEYQSLKLKAKGKKGEEWRLIQRDMINVQRKACKENVSLVPKKEFSPNATEQERFDYFMKEVFPVMNSSEASALDGLEMFEKYGVNKAYDKNGSPWTTMFELEGGVVTIDRNAPAVNGSRPVTITDRLANRYLDVFAKYAKKEQGDARNLAFFFENSHKIMSEETALKYIATLKKFVFAQDFVIDPQICFVDRNLGRFKDNPKIIAAMDDLIEHVKDLPKS